MARKKIAATSGGIPAWFMTYSDVITLMMTFFILLLTFSTSEPETFEQMQIATFGSGGGTGSAGDNHFPIDRDSLLVRYRPRTARSVLRGSETLPHETDPVQDSVAKGLKSLEQPDELAAAERVGVETPIALLRNSDGTLTNIAKQQLHMLSLQLSKLPLEVEFQVSQPETTEFAVALAQHLFEREQIPPGRVSVGVVEESALPAGKVRMVMTRILRQK